MTVRFRLLIVAAVLFPTVGCEAFGCNDNETYIGPSGPTSIFPEYVLVEPATAQAVRGETRKFEASVQAQFDPNRYVTVWSTRSSIISVLGDGVSATAKCDGVGSGDVTATATPPTAVNPLSASATMDCIDALRLSVPPAVDHTVGTSPCPQALGSIGVVNASPTLPMTVSARSDNAAIEVAPASVTIPPQGVQNFQLTFNCKTQPKITAKIILTVVVEGTTLTYESNVTVNRGQ
jgi:hypothetical protein